MSAPYLRRPVFLALRDELRDVPRFAAAVFADGFGCGVTCTDLRAVAFFDVDFLAAVFLAAVAFFVPVFVSRLTAAAGRFLTARDASGFDFRASPTDLPVALT